jgi:hypothetical protein
MTDVRTVYQRARIETAKLLGYGDDLEQLTAEQSTRLDVACALRIALDDQAAKLLRGESTDVAKLLSASEALAKLLPATVLASPPPPANAPDPRRIMFENYMAMRARGAAFGEGYDGKVRRIAELEARIAELEAAGASSGTNAPVGGTNVPVADNVVPLARPTGANAPAGGANAPAVAPPAPAAPPKPAPQPQATGIICDDVGSEPWRGYVGGRPYDRWSDNRT